MANTTRRRATATADSFAHLAGLGRTSLAARAEDETDDEKKEREDKERAAQDDEYEKKEAAGEDTGESDDDKDARHARQTARGATAEDDSDDDGDDDSDKKDMRGSGSGSQAFRRATARCAAIFATQAAGRNPVLAAELAFRSELTRSEAIRALRAAVSTMPTVAHRPDRAAANPKMGSGAGNGPVDAGALWDRVLAKAGHLPAARR
jgi:cobalamin biosynthesis protein CobT